MNPNDQVKESNKSLGESLSKVKKLFQANESFNHLPSQESHQPTSSTAKSSEETYHAWGVRWSGNANADNIALPPALQSCYTQNVHEQNNNQAVQQKNQENINSQIHTNNGLRDGEKIKLESKQKEKNRHEDDIKGYRNKIDEIKSSGGTNDIMAKVNFYIGAIITGLLAIYLFVFYSSASFSAFFGNDNISGAGEAIFDSHCYAEAVSNGIGQLFFILLMPVIFLGLGFLIHQFGESEKGWSKYVKIGSLYIVTFIFDGLLAFEISEKVYLYTVLSSEQYTVGMAFNSPSFWIVIFAGFVAYVIWGMVFDFTLQHFDNMNAHTKEIKVLEDKIKNSKVVIDNLDTQISQIQLKINSIETEIARLTDLLNGGTVIDKNILKRALSDFFNGWLAYMTLAARSQDDREHASDIYESFISTLDL